LYKPIVKELDKLKELENKKKTILSNKKEYENYIKNNNVNYNEVTKKIKELKKDKDNIYMQIMKQKFKIVNNSYIIPLILPIKLDISY
jgi:formyltetrahydrofolate hydrolase